MANTTWNPADKTAGVTLTGSNLIATTAGASQGVRGAHSQTSGKYYWEYTYTTIATNSFDVGIGPTSYVLSSGTLTNIAVVTRLSGNLNVNGSIVATLGTINTGNVIGVAVDFTAQLIWVRIAPSGNWNASGTADPATGTGGASFSVLSGALYPLFIGGSTDKCTANFGDTAFSGTTPSSFTAGFPAGAAASAQARALILA